jgi:plasmid stabilization system protein ParE
VARIEASAGALRDLERLFECVAEDRRRELVLSRGRCGYIAKYRWLPAEDVVLILAVRHQRQAGYTEEQ